MVKLKLPLPLSKLKKKADRLFSEKRRREESDLVSGYCFCITCNAYKHWKEMDAGHFINRGYLPVRYEKNNVWPQCKKCNRYRSGDHSRYRDELIKIVGREEVERLEKKKYEVIYSVFSRALCDQVIKGCEEWKTKHPQNIS